MTGAAHRFNNDLRYVGTDHPRQWHLTPEYVLQPVREDLGGVIDLDPCTFPDNPTGAVQFYTASDGGEHLPWDASTIFANPPYAKAREPWVHRCVQAGAEGKRVVLLIPAATDTRIFQMAMETSTAGVFIRGRVKFGTRRENRRQHAASHPSALIGWNTELLACSELGLRVASNPASVSERATGIPGRATAPPMSAGGTAEGQVSATVTRSETPDPASRAES